MCPLSFLFWFGGGFFMLVWIDAKPVKNEAMKRKMKRLTKRKVLNRQDTIDDEGLTAGQGRGPETPFNKQGL
jgi:hypothetical protein